MPTSTNPRRNDKIALLIFALILFVFVLNVAKETFITPANMWVSPVASHQPSVTALWSLSNVYVQSSSKPSIATQDNKMIVLGSTNISSKASVMALDEQSGQLLWSMGYPGLSMAIGDSKVFVGGMTRVLALDIQNGSTVWSTFVKANVVEIRPQDEHLYVYGTSGGRDYLINASNGEVVEELDQADRIEHSPALMGIQGDIISNVATTPSAVYALSKDGSLLKRNQETGEQETLFMFTDAPFVVYQFEYPYYVTIDPQTNILFVYLGDSAQLYAFQLQSL